MRLARLLLAGTGLTTAALLTTPVAAQAAWNATGQDTLVARAAVLPAGPSPRVTVGNGSSVKVEWSAVPGPPVRGYEVVRTDEATGLTEAAERGCAGVRTGLSCTEGSMPPGRWTYGIVLLVGDRWTSPPGFGPTVQVKPSKTVAAPPQPTPIPSATPSQSSTPSASPSASPSPSPSASPSQTPSPSVSASPSATPSASPSQSSEPASIEPSASPEPEAS
jgi:hypothetical protein